MVEILRLSGGDEAVLDRCAEGVFDDPIDRRAAAEFLGDSRHHMVVAVDGGVVVGFVSAVHAVHPDEARPEMWINEVSVAVTHRRRGLARAMLEEILQLARGLGCSQAWVLTERSNSAAMGLYSAAGGSEDPGDTVIFAFFLSECEEES